MSNVTKMPDHRGMSWEKLMMRNDKGNYLTHVCNAITLLQYLPELRELILLNEFKGDPFITKAPPPLIPDGPTLAGPYPRAAEEADYTAIQSFLQRHMNINFTFPVVRQATDAVAVLNKFHPVRDWLQSLKWDGTSRVKGWLHTVFGSPCDKYHEDVGTKFLVAAVSRIFEPGCKFDYVPILGGTQGIGKSAAFRTLFSEKWFKDRAGKDVNHKDVAIGLRGTWGVELAELQAMKKSSAEDMKAFITSQVDKYRPPYGRTEKEYPRQCVFVGTTNDDDYLTDKTGNRRFWPVDCDKADTKWLRNNREQLWAEAVALYRSGEIELYLDDPSVAAIAQEKQEDKMPDDPWEVAVKKWLRDREGIRNDAVDIYQVLRMALNLPEHSMDKAKKKIGSIMKRCGWIKKRMPPDKNGYRASVWIKRKREEP